MENNKLKVMAFAFASSITWGFCIFFVGLVHMYHPEYGTDFLNLASSVYPGYKVEPGIGSVITGTVYALVDGGVGGAFFCILYNLCLCCPLCKKNK